MTEDNDEAPFVYGFLADLVEANNPHILGPNNANLPRIVAIIAEAIACEVTIINYSRDRTTILTKVSGVQRVQKTKNLY